MMPPADPVATTSSLEEDSLWLEESSQITATNELFRRRLHRRTCIIDELRKAYLRDVVAVQRVLAELDTVTKERLKSVLGTDTCVDLTAPLKLFAPAETILDVKPCEACGGTLELTYQNSSEMQKLKQEIEKMRQKHSVLNQEFARTRANLLAARETVEQMTRSHMTERQLFLEQVTMLKNQLEELTTCSTELKSINQKLRGENTHFRVSLEHQTALISELHKKLERHRSKEDTQRKLLTDNENLFDDYQAACAEVKRLRSHNEQLQQKVDVLMGMVEPLQSSHDQLQAQISPEPNAAAGVRGQSVEELRRMQSDLRQANSLTKSQQREHSVLEKRTVERTQQPQLESPRLPVANPTDNNSGSAERWQDSRASSQQQLLPLVSTRSIQNDMRHDKSDGSSEELPKLSLPEVMTHIDSASTHQKHNTSITR